MQNKPKTKKTSVSFEEALKNLEEIVAKLENGEVNLSELVELHKNGQKYQKICKDFLDRAKLEIESS